MHSFVLATVSHGQLGQLSVRNERIESHGALLFLCFTIFIFSPVVLLFMFSCSCYVLRCLFFLCVHPLLKVASWVVKICKLPFFLRFVV